MGTAWEAAIGPVPWAPQPAWAQARGTGGHLLLGPLPDRLGFCPETPWLLPVCLALLQPDHGAEHLLRALPGGGFCAGLAGQQHGSLLVLLHLLW